MIKNRLIACLALVCPFGCLASCDTKKDDFKTDLNIKVYTRPTTSGTRECFFEKSVMQMERRVDLFPKLTKWLKW